MTSSEVGYDVHIKCVATGETRVFKAGWGLPWNGDQMLYWWTDGNFGCDCNRGDSFRRAGGEDIEEHEECGSERFLVTCIDAGDAFYCDDLKELNPDYKIP